MSKEPRSIRSGRMPPTVRLCAADSLEASVSLEKCTRVLEKSTRRRCHPPESWACEGGLLLRNKALMNNHYAVLGDVVHRLPLSCNRVLQIETDRSSILQLLFLE